MPGIFGLAGNHPIVQDTTVRNMAEGCVHSDAHCVTATKSLKGVSGQGNVQFSQVDYVRNKAPSISTVGNSTCCIWGEVYDVDEWGIDQERQLSPSQILATAEEQGALAESLASIEGAVAAAIYKAATDQLGCMT